MVVRQISSKKWTLLQANTLPPQTVGSSSGMHATLNVWFLLHIGETYNKTGIRKGKYWFANEVMNMADEQIKNDEIKLVEGQAQVMSKDNILEVIGKDKSFTLLKEVIHNKKEHLSDKFTPLLQNYCKVILKKAPNVALLKFIENNGEYLKKGVDGTSITKKNRKEY